MCARDCRARWWCRSANFFRLILGLCVLVAMVALIPADPPWRSVRAQGEQLPYKHGPFSAGKCTLCHTAHDASDDAGLVTTEKQLCFFCHTQAKQDFAMGVRHQPVREQPCTVCHDPHESSSPKLLKKPEGELCIGCHKDVGQEANRAFVHKPVKEGRCTACHDPHSSPYPHLLRAAFAQEFYGPFSTRRFALCFNCHSVSLALERTGFGTGFRNGTVNEHYFHVNDPVKGRACWACHEPHGSTQAHLIRKEVSFGNWRLPITFTPLETGGGCLCGCHKRLDYRR